MSSLNNDKEIQTETIDREQLFIEALAVEPSIRAAGLKAGYSVGYAESTLPRRNPLYDIPPTAHHRRSAHTVFTSD